VPAPARVIRSLWFLSISGRPDMRIAKEFGIFTKSTMLHNLQSSAQENRYQHFDSPETDLALYVTISPGIERLAKGYRDDVLYRKRWLTNLRLIRRVQPSIFLLRIDGPVYLRFTLLSRLMVSDLIQHTNSIQRQILTGRHSLFTCDPTPGTTQNRVYPHRITFEWFILLDGLNLSLPAHKVSSLRRYTVRCTHTTSHSPQATIWIYSWSVCEGRSLNATTDMLHVNVSHGGRCSAQAYCRCTAVGDE
jgi:hypothetical protein